MIRSFGSDRFRRFALAKFLSLLGQNSLVYAIFILVIQDQESSFATSLYVVATIVPSVLLSVPGGLVADLLPKKGVLLVVGLVRAVVVLVLVANGLALGTVLVLTLIIWSVWQFYTPAENAALRAVVDEEGLSGANATLQVVSIAAQLAGAGFLAPIGLKVIGANPVFVVCALSILGASAVYASIDALTPRHGEPGRSRNLLTGLQVLRDDPHAMQAAVLLAVVSSALLVVVVAVPEFLSDTLRTSPSNAVYIFAPAAGGLAIGLILAPLLTRLAGSRATTLLGYTLFAACLVALGAVQQTADFWEQTVGFPLDGIEDRLRISRLVAATLLTVPVGGLGLALVNVGARTLLYERAPPGTTAQLLAAQSALGSLVAVIPTLLAGLLVDHVEVQTVLVGLSVLLVGLGLLQVVRQPDTRQAQLAPS